MYLREIRGLHPNPTLAPRRFGLHATSFNALSTSLPQTLRLMKAGLLGSTMTTAAVVGTGYWGRNHVRLPWPALRNEGLFDRLVIVEAKPDASRRDGSRSSAWKQSPSPTFPHTG